MTRSRLLQYALVAVLLSAHFVTLHRSVQRWASNDDIVQKMSETVALVAPSQHVQPAVRSPFDSVGERLTQSAQWESTFRLTRRDWRGAVLPRCEAVKSMSSSRNALVQIASGQSACELFLWKLGVCNMTTGLLAEPIEQCIARLGARNLANILPDRCRESKYFEQMLGTRDNGNDIGHQLRRDVRAEDWWGLPRSPIYRQQVETALLLGSKKPYIAPSERPSHSYRTGPRVCRAPNSTIAGCTMHPIGFAVPEDQIVTEISRVKLFEFLPFIPRRFPLDLNEDYSLQYNDEFLSNILYQHSFFAFTHRRGGWDCLRHYEALAAGILPYFPDLVACGKFCMPHLPKDLLAEITSLPGLQHIGALPSKNITKYRSDFVELTDTYHLTEKGKQTNFIRQGTIDWLRFDAERYFALAEKLLSFTREHLTTKSLVTYMLKVIRYREPKNVLVLTGNYYRYLIQSIVHGLYDLGFNYTVWPLDTGMLKAHEKRVWSNGTGVISQGEYEALDEATRSQESWRSVPLTESELENGRFQYRNWQGLLYVFGMRVTPPKIVHHDAEVRQRILNKEYDLVIYPWTVHGVPGTDVRPVLTKDKPFWAEVSAVLPASRIVFVDTTDDVFNDPDEVLRDMCGKGHIFRRSLHDVDC